MTRGPRHPGSPAAATIVADRVRVAGVLSILGSLVWLGGVEVALFALVLLGLVLPRVLRLPAGLDLAVCATLLAAAWISVIDLYALIAWLDLLVHLVATGLLAAVAYLLLARAHAVPGAGDPQPARHRLGTVTVTAAAGLSLGLLWDFGEWFGHTYVDDAINVGYDDTMGDLAAGALGSLVAGLALAGHRPTSARGGGDAAGRGRRAPHGDVADVADEGSAR